MVKHFYREIFSLTVEYSFNRNALRKFIGVCMSKWTILAVICFLGLSACNTWHRIETHEFLPVDINRHETNLSSWMYADLKGDETDYMITSDTSSAGVSAIYVSDIKGKVVSQINNIHPFRSIKVLADPRDNGHWLFYSYNDKKNVFLDAAKYNWQIPLQRETKRFQSIPRQDRAIDNLNIDYYGQVTPQILDDIDSDGRMELVCLGADGFTTNPRGVIVYDFISGTIKWRFDTPCNIASLIWRDFDLDGKKELIFGTTALKNTTTEINGLDDANGWIGVLSTSGELLYKEQQFSGFGQVNVDIADQEKDGKLEIYVVNTTWGSENNRNTASMYNWTGTRLQRTLNLQMASSLERIQINDFLRRMDVDGTSRLHLADKSKGLIVLDASLRVYPHKCSEYAKIIWAIEDINQDGNKEILMQTDDNYLLILDNNYNCKARIKNPFPEENAFSMSIVRTGIENDPLISIGTNREVRYYKYSRIPFWKLIFQLYKGYAIYLNLLLVALLVFFIHRYSQRLKIMTMTANQLGEGMMVLVNARKVMFRNHVVVMMAEHTADPACKDLQLCFPNLYKAMCRFVSSGADHSNYTEKLGNGDQDESYKITIFRTRNIRTLYIITIYPDLGDNATLQDRLLWADVARRLSHHVRRHITNIILALEALQQDKDAVRSEYYQIIGSEIEKVRVFTHAFQRFTELKDYELQLQDIIPSMEHCLARITLPENVKLVKSWSLHSVFAYIEPIRFEEAIVNTISNALEAMPEGGNLHILIKEFPPATSPQLPHSILVEIEDSGCGIPAKYMDDIWRPFFTTNQSGTGIGIPETKKIIDSLGGLMFIQSEVGVGTTVSFWLKGEK